MRNSEAEWSRSNSRHGRRILAAMLLLGMIPCVHARDLTFLHISDQHYNVDEDGETDGGRRLAKTIAAMNDLPGTSYPKEIGGEVDEPRGVILTGDLVNDGIPAEWKIFVAQWGLTGEEGLIDYPVYEGAGNHDGPPSTVRNGHKGFIRRQIIKRNQQRPGVANVSENGLHYSWDWDNVHFVMLNEYAGPEDDNRYRGNPDYDRKMQRYGNPAEKSLQFLRRDLASQVGDSKRPIVLMQHYGFGPFPLRPWGDDAAWWTEEHAMRLWETIEGYNVISILCGHDGSEAVIDWNGIPNRHMDDVVRFGVYRIRDDTMTVAQRNAKSGKWEAVYEQPVRIDASLPPELVQGPYLVYNGKPGTMTVLWRTKTNVPCTLQWGDDRFEYEDGTVEVEPCDEERLLYRHTITDLEPNACIKYALEIDGAFAPGMFYAEPKGADKVKFLIAGGQPDAETRNKLYETLYDKIYQDAAYHSIILHPGDMVSNPDALDSWDQEFFSRNEDARHVRWMQSRSPLAVAPRDSELKQRLFPASQCDFGAYSFNYGPVHIAVLNARAGLAPGSKQNEWLRDTLETTAAPWRVLMWNPPKDKAAEEDFLVNLQPICDHGEVDLCVFGGERSEGVRCDTTTYLSAGTHSIAVQAEGDTLTCEVFEADGDAVDILRIDGAPSPL